MSEQEGRLSPKAAQVLTLIAQGRSYAQIVEGNPDLSYLDIFAAAKEALDLDERPSPYDARMIEIKRRHPRAYEKWSRDEDEELWEMHAQGESNEAIAQHLGRQPSAIRSRLDKHAFVRESLGWED